MTVIKKRMILMVTTLIVSIGVCKSQYDLCECMYNSRIKKEDFIRIKDSLALSLKPGCGSVYCYGANASGINDLIFLVYSEDNLLSVQKFDFEKKGFDNVDSNKFKRVDSINRLINKNVNELISITNIKRPEYDEGHNYSIFYTSYIKSSVVLNILICNYQVEQASDEYPMQLIFSFWQEIKSKAK